MNLGPITGKERDSEKELCKAVRGTHPQTDFARSVRAGGKEGEGRIQGK